MPLIVMGASTAIAIAACSGGSKRADAPQPTTSSLASGHVEQQPFTGSVLTVVDAHTGKTLLRVKGTGEPRFFSLIGVTDGLALGEEAPCQLYDNMTVDPARHDIYYAARDAVSGRRVWERPIRGVTVGRGPQSSGSAGEAAHVFSSAPVVVFARDGALLGLDLQTGREVWRTPTSDLADGDEVEIVEDTSTAVILGSRDADDRLSETFVVDRSTGNVIWKFRPDSDTVGGPIAANDDVVVVATNARLPLGRAERRRV